MQNSLKSESEDERSGRRRRRAAEAEESGSEKDDSDDDRPRKRGRPRTVHKDHIKGFSDAEVRRFIRSYKKFSVPLKRLEAIAMDAELQEKPLADLKKLAELLHEGCENCMKEYLAKQQESTKLTPGEEAVAKRRDRGPSFKFSGVAVNAKSLLNCETEMEPLDILLPSDPDERHKWVIPYHCKPTHWDVPWENEDDSKLLSGIYEHGLGNWEAMKMDTNLGLHEKVRFIVLIISLKVKKLILIYISLIFATDSA